MITFGSNSHGQLGNGTLSPSPVPVRALAPPRVLRCAAGSRTCFVVAQGGQVVGVGAAGQGQQGVDVDEECVLVPRGVRGGGGMGPVADVATRGSHCVALTTGGGVWGWGRGDGGYADLVGVAPRRVRFPVQGVVVVAVAAGRMHSVALDALGRCWAWGISDQGQCGLGSCTAVPTPALVAGGPGAPAAPGSAFTQVACGSRHTLALTTQGQVWGWGSSSHSQLGRGPNATSAELVPVQVFEFPVREASLLGGGSTTTSMSSPSPSTEYLISCGYRHSLCATVSGGRVWGFGWNDCRQAVPRLDQNVVHQPTELHVLDPPNQHEILAISGGGRHTLCATYDRVKRETVVWGWGRNACSELGSVADMQPVTQARAILRAKQRIPTVLAAGWEHSVVVTPSEDAFQDAAQEEEEESTLHGGARWWLRRVVSLGDLDAAMSQFVNVMVLVRVLDGMGHRAQASLATTLLSNMALAAWALRMGGASTTPLPHGPNTIALFALETSAFRPTFLRTGGDLDRARAASLFCTVSLGLLELVAGAPSARVLRRYVPRAALLSSVAGVALVFICANFFSALFEDGFGLAPLMVFLIGLGARDRMPFGIPVAFAALVVGGVLQGVFGQHSSSSSSNSSSLLASPLPWSPPLLSAPVEAWHAMTDPSHYWLLVSVVFPLFTINLVNNLACVEQARTVGDEYDVTSALRIDALATVLGAVFLGMISPTCFYVGSVGYKAWGASYKYPLINSALLLAVLVRWGPFMELVQLSPRTSAVGILVVVGALVTSEAFKVKRHGIAVVLGLVPALAAFHASFRDSDQHDPQQLLQGHGRGGSAKLDAFHVVGHGYMLCSMVFSSIVAHVLDRKYLVSSAWLGVAAVLTGLGFIHEGDGEVAFGYVSSMVLVGAWGAWKRVGGEGEEGGGDEGGDSQPPPPIPSLTSAASAVSQMGSAEEAPPPPSMGRYGTLL